MSRQCQNTSRSIGNGHHERILNTTGYLAQDISIIYSCFPHRLTGRDIFLNVCSNLLVHISSPLTLPTRLSSGISLNKMTEAPNAFRFSLCTYAICTIFRNPNQSLILISSSAARHDYSLSFDQRKHYLKKFVSHVPRHH